MLHRIKGKLFLITKIRRGDLFPGKATSNPKTWLYYAQIETGLSCPRWDYVAVDKSKTELMKYIQTYYIQNYNV